LQNGTCGRFTFGMFETPGTFGMFGTFGMYGCAGRPGIRRSGILKSGIFGESCPAAEPPFDTLFVDLKFNRTGSANSYHIAIFQFPLIGNVLIVYSSSIATTKISDPKLSVPIFDHCMIFRNSGIAIQADGIVGSSHRSILNGS